jgi:transcriptional regulator with XRE-family HTH domain
MDDAAELKGRFGKMVRTRRNCMGISQEALAARAGLHRTYIADIERGARNPSLESINKLASALEVSMSALFSPSPPAQTGASPTPQEAV